MYLMMRWKSITHLWQFTNILYDSYSMVGCTVSTVTHTCLGFCFGRFHILRRSVSISSECFCISRHANQLNFKLWITGLQLLLLSILFNFTYLSFSQLDVKKWQKAPAARAQCCECQLFFTTCLDLLNYWCYGLVTPCTEYTVYLTSTWTVWKLDGVLSKGYLLSEGKDSDIQMWIYVKT